MKLNRVEASTFSLTAAFRRLCIETTLARAVFGLFTQPPSGGCVLKQGLEIKVYGLFRSRLQAAVY